MALLCGDELERVIELFTQRGAQFYHACQLKDFRTYLDLKGIPSREVMEESGLPYTPFATDPSDRENGCWSKVFGNLSDFGFPFAGAEWKNNNTAPIPNPYGPILLELKPTVLREADDVAICLRSAGGNDFNRDAESLGTADEVGRLFENGFDPNQRYTNAYVKFSEGLRREFADRVKPASVAGWATLNPEASCSVEDGRLSFAHLAGIVVDGYDLDNVALSDLVAQNLRKAGVQTRVRPRRYRPEAARQRILSDLARVLRPEPVTIEGFLAAANLSNESMSWARRVQTGNLGWVFERFATYLHVGTLAEMI